MVKIGIISIVLSLWGSLAYAQSEGFNIFFRQGESLVEPSFSGNEQTLEELIVELKGLSSNEQLTLHSVDIEGYASPEGEVGSNYSLSQRRCEAAQRVVLLSLPQLHSLLFAQGRGVIDQEGEEHYPQLRVACVKPSFSPVATASIAPTLASLHHYAAPDMPLYHTPSRCGGKPLFALKTNMLFALALMPNLEVEVPIGARWSVAGEWLFPWWQSYNNRYALQLLSTMLEVRYWFSEPTLHPPLTGWFVGVYGGGGDYDIRWRGEGRQGEFYIPAGLSGGYAHSINWCGNLRLEYSLGVAVVKSNYREYQMDNCSALLVKSGSGRLTTFVPTRVKVSFVWLLYKRRGYANN